MTVGSVVAWQPSLFAGGPLGRDLDYPGLRRIHTDNAEENAPMLAINVALGFTAVGVVAAWQRRVAT